ncbi:putative MFS-type transporter, partial [Neolecta irregularis DAH-3]
MTIQIAKENCKSDFRLDHNDIPTSGALGRDDELSQKAHEDTHYLPTNRIMIVFLGLMITVFLAALDQSIIATALPSIISDLGDGYLYSWVGLSYVLASTVFLPLYGKLSDLVGRKPVLYGTIVIFLIGSALCGLAQSMT